MLLFRHDAHHASISNADSGLLGFTGLLDIKRIRFPHALYTQLVGSNTTTLFFTISKSIINSSYSLPMWNYINFTYMKLHERRASHF